MPRKEGLPNSSALQGLSPLPKEVASPEQAGLLQSSGSCGFSNPASTWLLPPPPRGALSPGLSIECYPLGCWHLFEHQQGLLP